MRLVCRPPYDWAALLAFLAARATPGVEAVSGDRYRRTIEIGGQAGVLDVSHPATDAIELEVRFPNPSALPIVVERAGRVFDIDADPARITERLQSDPLLRRPLEQHSGIRVPGAWDGFELAVRAILGQQVSVRGATTLAGRLASWFGSPAAADGTLHRLFPTPAQLADAALEEVGVMPARAEAIRALARAAAEGAIPLGAIGNGGAGPVLRAIRGIGAWTAEYIAMRAFKEPDAFPSGDRVLQRLARSRTARELDQRAEAWRPFRAYAVMLLWQDAVDRQVSPAAGA